MLSVKQRYHDISPVTLQVVGGAVSASLYCGEVEGLSGGLVESFLVELYRCKLCQFTCGLKASISSHLLLRHPPPTLTYLGGADEGVGAEDREGAGPQRGASTYQLDLNGGSKQSDEDEEFLLYNMLDNMSPPTCDISSEGGLQIAHTCEVSTLFEEESSIFPLKGGAVDLSCPINPPATQEEMAQSAHLMTLGLCRISAAKPPPPHPPSASRPIHPPPDDSPCLWPPDRLKQSETDSRQTRTSTSSKRRLPCLLCPSTLPSRRLLDVHVRSHRAAGGFSCVCCSWMADSWEELEPHWRSHCRTRSRRRGGRREEQKQEKKKKKKKKEKVAIFRRFSCAVCLRTFRSNTSRKIHQQTHNGCFQHHHNNRLDGWSGRMIGRIGGKEADSTNSQTSRIQTGSLQSFTEKKQKTRGKTKEEEKRGQEAGFCCSLCHRKFSTKLTLRRHLGVHGGEKPFTCPHCSYSSRLKASLLQHLRTHTGEKPYRCAECPYASIDRSSLLRHSRTHSQEKPYRCQHCDYSSIQKKSLDLHARRHHTGEAFPCQQCEYSTPDRQLLLRHIRRNHAPTPPASMPHCDLTGGQVEVRAELSDGNFLQLNRTDEDLARMLKRLVDGCLDDRETLSFSLLTGVFRTSDPETKTVEMNSLLKSIINLPHEFSQSEAVLAFFEPSAGDQISRQTEDQILEQEEDQTLRLEAENQTLSREQDRTIREEDQDLSVFQSLVGLSEIMTSNGFCLANTETILFDLTPPTHHVTQSDDSSGRRASIGAAVCLELCRPSVSPHLLRGFTGMMGRLVNRGNLRHRSAQPPCPASSTCCSPGLRRQTSWTE